MTRDDAFAEAAASTAVGKPLEVWEHVGGKLPGGKTVLPQARFITRDQDKPAPKFVWRKGEPVPVATTEAVSSVGPVTVESAPVVAPVVEKPTPEAIADFIIDTTRDWFTKEDAPKAFAVMREAIVGAIRTERVPA